MKRYLSHILFSLLALLGILSFTSCDKFDDNGPFYGYWLLTDIDSAEGPLGTAPEQGSSTINTDLIEVNTDKTVTWAVRNELIMMRDFSGQDYYFFTFRRDATTLQLLEAYYNDGSNDTRIDFSEVPAQYYIPADGTYEVVRLDNKGMVLRYGELTLTLKKN